MIEEKENFEENLKKLDGLLNEEYEFESYINDEEVYDEDKIKELPFDELERKAFYELEET